MESLQHALGHSVAIAAKIGYKLFENTILHLLFLMDDEHLEMAIEKDVDLLGMFMIHAPRHLKAAQQLVSRIGRGYRWERKITKERALKWVKEKCEARGRRAYAIIVNVPKVEQVEKNHQVAASDKMEEVYPPPGADMKRVEWFWTNVVQILRFIFRGEVSTATKKWGVGHLKWLNEQQAQGKTELPELIESVKEMKGNEESTKPG